MTGTLWDPKAPEDIQSVYQQYFEQSLQRFFADYDAGRLVLPAVE